MSTPYQCPKCGGIGALQYDPNMPFGSNTNCGPWSCPPCGGTGIIYAKAVDKGVDRKGHTVDNSILAEAGVDDDKPEF